MAVMSSSSSSSSSKSSMVLWISDLFSSSSSSSSGSFEGSKRSRRRGAASLSIRKPTIHPPTQRTTAQQDDTIVARQIITASSGNELELKPAATLQPPLKDITVPEPAARRKRRHYSPTPEPTPIGVHSAQIDLLTGKSDRSQQSAQEQHVFATAMVKRSNLSQRGTSATPSYGDVRFSRPLPTSTKREAAMDPPERAPSAAHQLLLGLNPQLDPSNMNSSSSALSTQKQGHATADSSQSVALSSMIASLMQQGLASGNNGPTYQRTSIGQRSSSGLITLPPQYVSDAQNNTTGTHSILTSNADFAGLHTAMRMRHGNATFVEDLGPFSESSSDTTRYQSESTREVIKEPREQDILLGRGSSRFMHPANQRLRFIVETYREIYDGCLTRVEKTDLTDLVVQLARTTDDEMDGEQGPKGRFLEYRRDLQGWVEIDDDRARQKVSHLFRGKPNSFREDKSKSL